MKKLFKGLALGLALTAATVAPAFAQDECDTLYNGTFIPNYKSTDLTKMKTAIDAGNSLVAKCSTVEAYKEPIAFVQKKLPAMEKAYALGMAIQRFNTALKDPKAVNADEAFASGKDILTIDPNFPNYMDVTLTLASVGLDQALANNNKFNADTINYAKQSIQKIEANTPSKDYGLYSWIYKTQEFPDGKNNALAWMNYTIGYIMYNAQKMDKDALPYYYKAIQFNSNVKKRPDVYQAIGDFYKKEYNRIDDERTGLAKEAEAATDDAVKKEKIDKAKELLALQKGYADRMIDAYGRAYKLAPETDKAYKDALYNTLNVLYQVRFDGKKDGVDQYISTVVAKPMPDPTSTVAPIAETTTTATTSSATPTTVPTTAPVTVKPANGTTATTKTVANGATTYTTKTTPAKKPVTTKKKGTR